MGSSMHERAGAQCTNGPIAHVPLFSHGNGALRRPHTLDCWVPPTTSFSAFFTQGRGPRDGREIVVDPFWSELGPPWFHGFDGWSFAN